MWIPYGLQGHLKAESAPATIEQSKADRSERDIVVGFFVMNPVTQTWEIDISAASATDVLQTTIGGVAAVVAFYGGDAGKVNEVIYRLRAPSPLEAFTVCYRDLEDRLARWALELGRGMAIAGWQIADPQHKARWRCTPFRPSAVALDPTVIEGAPPGHQAVLALYRNARNASDPAWRLLCAVSILRSWQRQEEPFASTNRRLAYTGGHRREHRVTFEMLVHSGAIATAPDLRDRPFEDLIDRLEPLRETIMRQLDRPHGEMSGFEARSALVQMANLADTAAREVLLEELAFCSTSEMLLAS
ncbi:methylamine utilization protein MauJ [Microvirga massiliensis]|uniref:methylamine utilization protein MauJ n=1 Tax=Microvirga massiliensis TaxID=1033741 RepID=UPI00062B2FA5|nr:methylamine utilization protein MauJ [Microvirga massiliensis]